MIKLRTENEYHEVDYGSGSFYLMDALMNDGMMKKFEVEASNLINARKRLRNLNGVTVVAKTYKEVFCD